MVLHLLYVRGTVLGCWDSGLGEEWVNLVHSLYVRGTVLVVGTLVCHVASAVDKVKESRTVIYFSRPGAGRVPTGPKRK